MTATQLALAKTHDAIRVLRWRVRRALLVDALAIVLLGLMIHLAITLPLDRWLRLELFPRAFLFAAGLATILWWLCTRVLAPLTVPLSEEDLALSVERTSPRLAQKLVSAVQFERTLERGVPLFGESRDLMTAVIGSVEDSAAGIPYDDAVRRARVAGSAAITLACAATLLGAVLVAPSTMRLWAHRNLALGSAEWPRATRLTLDGVVDGKIRLPKGDDLTVQAQASGVIPESLEIRYWFDGGERGREPMAQVGEATSADGTMRFAFTFAALIEPVRFRVQGGDGLTEDVDVVLVDRPRVHDLAMTLHYPEYMQRPSEELSQVVKNQKGVAERVVPGDIKVVAGSRLEVTAQSTKEIKRAFILHGGGAKQGSQRSEIEVGTDRRTLRGSFKPEQTGLFAVDVLDRDDLSTGQPPRILIRVLEDKEPRVTYKPFGIGGMVTPVARIPARLKTVDDYGLTAVEATAKVAEPPRLDASGGEASMSKPAEPAWVAVTMQGLEQFPGGPGTKALLVPFEQERIVLNLEATLNPDAAEIHSPRNRARPGTLLSLRVSARDNFGPGDPHIGHSETITLRVVTAAELLNDLMRRQEEARKEFQLMLKEEKSDRSEIAESVSPKTVGDLGDKVRSRLTAVLGRQRALSRRVTGIADRYQQILDEMRNNRLAEETHINRLEAEIVGRLRSLNENTIPPSVSALEAYREDGADATKAKTLAAYDEVIRQMERILKQMESLEHFSRVIEKLRDVIKDQTEAEKEARNRSKSDADRIFRGEGQETRPADQPAETSPPAGRGGDPGTETPKSAGGRETRPASEKNR